MSPTQIWPEPVQRVSAFLRAAAIDATVAGVPGAGRRPREAAAAAVGCRPDRIVKSLVFVCDGAYVLALVPGDRRGDEAQGRGRGRRRRGRGSRRAPEVVEATGFEPGAVAPFPHRAVSQTFVERLLFQHPTVWIGAGHELAHGLALARATCSASRAARRPISSAPR